MYLHLVIELKGFSTETARSPSGDEQGEKEKNASEKPKPGFMFKTQHTRLTDLDDRTLIAAGSPLFKLITAFAPGDIVRVMKRQTNGHTRAPRYIEDKEGVICASYGSFVFPDKHAEGLKSPEYLYNVEFQSRKLWPSGGARRDTVRLDLFEPYLEMRQ